MYNFGAKTKMEQFLEIFKHRARILHYINAKMTDSCQKGLPVQMLIQQLNFKRLL